MGREPPSDHWHELGEQPSEVRITVFSDSEVREPRKWLQRLGGIRIPTGVPGFRLVVVVLAIAAMLAIVAYVGGSSAPRSAGGRASEPGARGVAAAYGYPSPCLSVTLSAIDRAFARADFDHASQCGRYTGYPTAIFHRIDREWQPVLEAVSYPCPVAGIPPGVQKELGVCP
jgi:hypothetical protein